MPQHHKIRLQKRTRTLATFALLAGLLPAASLLAQSIDSGSDTSVPSPYPVGTPMTMPMAVPTELVAEAASITQQFVGTLLPTLQLAMAAGGPLNAIEVCAVEAPAIAQKLSADTGWDVNRVSLKARNSSSATPDFWETMALSLFDQRQRDGEQGADINLAEVVAGEFRYMQAQPAAPLCLTCHGTDIAEDVRSALLRHYPNDMATGYSAGQIRGAISLRKAMP
ncbi:MAG: DUF3365 domain-containing protein [Pseudomonadota bacterium]